MTTNRIIILLLMCSLLVECLNKPLEALQQDARRPPPLMNGEALMVHIGVYMESLGKFSAIEMSFEADLYLYQSWRDPSLSHSGPGIVLVRDDSVRKQLWTPDLYFSNARSAQFHQVTAPNFNMFISPNGTVAYSSRVTLTVACNLDLVNYPLDRQACAIRILSYAYVESQMNVTWFRRNPIRYNPEIGPPEFSITGVRSGYCDGTYDYAITEFSHQTDRFSCLEGIIDLRRSIGYHLVLSFIPTGMIVCISWVSFFIDRQAVPARVTLSFTTLLALSTLGNGLRFGLPQVSYAKAIDYWFGGCMIFLLASLFEFAIVNSYMRKANKCEQIANRRKKGSDGNNEVMESEDDNLDVIRKPSEGNWPRQEMNGGGWNEPISIEKKRSSSTVNHEERWQSIRMVNGQYVVYDLHLPLLPDSGVHFGKGVHGDVEADRSSSWLKQRGNGNKARNNSSIRTSRYYSRKALLVDKRSRIAFPLAFVVMNIVFWSYYLVYLGDDREKFRLSNDLSEILI